MELPAVTSERVFLGLHPKVRTYHGTGYRRGYFSGYIPKFVRTMEQGMYDLRSPTWPTHIRPGIGPSGHSVDVDPGEPAPVASSATGLREQLLGESGRRV